jgi:RNA polymerase sigma-70 factor (ECF subfamily)
MRPDLSAGGSSDAAASFEPLRPLLVRIAYRMLGSVAEAEDIVQDAYLRWHETDRGRVRDAAAFLSKVVTRLCLDHLKSARIKRESYVGQWLPEPFVETTEPNAPDSDDLSVALMLSLERLSPLERAAFLLHDVFGLPFAEIAETLGRDVAACRKLATRAREHVRAERPRFRVAQDEGRRIADAFLAASRSGDLSALRSLLAADVVAYTDGGGIRPAALQPIVGQDAVAQFFAGIAEMTGFMQPPVLHRGTINALPGYVTLEQDRIPQTTALEIRDGRITAIYIVRNPEKLRHLAVLAP